MKPRTPQQTALLLAVILQRSGQNRARISKATIRLLANRDRNVRDALVDLVNDPLGEYGWVLVPRDIGSYSAMRTKLLDAAKAVTAKRWLTAEERRELKNDTIDWSALETEVEEPAKEEDGEDSEE
jgi:hypothetical protein